jgi:general secretion pathway protein L
MIFSTGRTISMLRCNPDRRAVTAAASFLRRLSAWIDHVAAGVTRLAAMMRRGRRVELIEQADGAFLAAEWRKGAAEPLAEPPLRLEQDRFADPISQRMRMLLAQSRVDVVLAPWRFVFRTLELPRGASQFLEGVVRSQIDRLTPWSASDAVFGWSSPVDAGADRIAIAVAATASALVAPIAQALVAARASHIRMSTRAGDGSAPIIPVFMQRSHGEDSARRLRDGLVIGLGLSGLAFALGLCVWTAVGGGYQAHLAELQNQIAERRAALLSRRGSAAEQAVQALQARRRAAPSAVMTLEALAKTLPDDTHLTELRIEDGKVQIVGLSGDAPALIRLIEQSRRFTRATFSAPTVRAPDGGETFHIEARIEPSFAVTD